MSRTKRLRKRILRDSLKNPEEVDDQASWLQNHRYTSSDVEEAFGSFDNLREEVINIEKKKAVQVGADMMRRGEFPSTPQESIADYRIERINKLFEDFNAYEQNVRARAGELDRTEHGMGKAGVLALAAFVGLVGGLIAYREGQNSIREQVAGQLSFYNNLASARSDSLGTYEIRLNELTAKADSLSGRTGDLEDSLETATSRVDTMYRTRTVRVPGTRTPNQAELDSVRRLGAEAARENLFSLLPSGPGNFDYTRTETPEEIIFTVNPRQQPLIPAQYNLTLTETRELDRYLEELSTIQGAYPDTIRRFTAGELNIYVAKNPFGEGVLGVRVERREQ